MKFGIITRKNAKIIFCVVPIGAFFLAFVINEVAIVVGAAVLVVVVEVMCFDNDFKGVISDDEPIDVDDFCSAVDL